jgi:hypothetical protein
MASCKQGKTMSADCADAVLAVLILIVVIVAGRLLYCMYQDFNDKEER